MGLLKKNERNGLINLGERRKAIDEVYCEGTCLYMGTH
jgi:hypothetical protein